MASGDNKRPAMQEISHNARKRSKVTITSSSAEEAAPTDPQARMSRWLNALSNEEAQEFHEIVNGAATSTVFLSNTLADRIRRCTNSLDEGRSGAFYVDEWLACQISPFCPVKDGKGKIGHPRIQINVIQKRVDPQSWLEKMRGALNEAAVTAFIALKSAGKKQVHLAPHQVAYNSRRTISTYKPIPDNCGRGASISHLCDQTGCVKPFHLVVAEEHQANTRLVNCTGMNLVVDANGCIVAELACKHATSRVVDIKALDTCCRRLNIVPIGCEWPELEEQEKDEEDASA